MVSITDDRGPGFLACSGILVFLALIVVGIRVYCRGTIRTHTGLKTGLGSDDYAMLVAMAFALFGFVCNVYEVRNGKGRHSNTLSRQQVSEAVKFGQLAQMQVLVGLYFAKLSIAFLMLRVAKRAMHMKFIVIVTYITTFLLTAVTIIVLVIWAIQCIPLEDIWKRPGKGRRCLDRHFVVHIVYLQSAVSLLTDLIFAVCPFYFTRNLQIAMSKKIALNVIMGLSLLTSVAGALKIVYMPDIEDTKDYTWDGFNVSICALIEETMAITLGSLPTIAPLFERARKQMTSRFTSSMSGGGGGGGSTLRSWPAGKRRTDTRGSMNDDVPLSGISVENTITVKSGSKMELDERDERGNRGF